MIPMVLARHIQSGLADYVETTFPMTNMPFRGSIRKLAHQEGMLSPGAVRIGQTAVPSGRQTCGIPVPMLAPHVPAIRAPDARIRTHLRR